jgi:hypothetical protein
MDQSLERSEVVELLRRLGESEDEVVLKAARDLHEKISRAGYDWDTLLAPDDGDDEILEDYDDDEEEDDASFSTAASETGDSLALIESLLTNKDISDSLREELQGYKEDIAENDFTESDATYLATLATRLKKGDDS